MAKANKTMRILKMYTMLINGDVLNKESLALEFKVDERSIQRDIDAIRNFFEDDTENQGFINTVYYDRAKKGYILKKKYAMKLSNSEVLAVCKILLDSRAFTKAEMKEIIDKLIRFCVPQSNQSLVTDLISNEEFHYVEPRHKTKFIDKLWDIGQAIRNHKYIEIDYMRTKDKAIVKRKVSPVAIMFSEYYFYLTAFIDDEEVRKGFDVINDSFPTIYRIDRIKKLKVLNEEFTIPYANRFQEGEFRKRIQFMYGGKLRKVKFKYTGYDIDAILDRLPTAQILSEEDGIYTIEAEVFGMGIDMWLRSQGKNIILCHNDMETNLNMHAENNNIYGLRNVFISSLDNDYSFEEYKRNYEYYKEFPGFFENHCELTVPRTDKRMWNEDYWNRLKIDLAKNFSKERMEHLLEVMKMMRKG